MSNLNLVKFLWISLQIILYFCLNACSKEKNNRDYIILDCSKDTVIEARNLREHYAVRNISLKVLGSVNDSCEVFLKDKIYGGYAGLFDFRIGEGDINLKDKSEIYSQDYQIVYLHKKATKGQLKIRLQLLSAAGDTLTDNE